MKIAIANDHSAVELKNEVKKYLEELGHTVVDYGTNSTDSVDYPKYGQKVALSIKNRENDCGVLICGTGIGMSLSANKVDGIRAAVCSEPYSARLSKEHNNANIIAFGARVVGVDMAKMIVREWLDAEYQAGRHAKRLELLTKIENNENLNS